MLYYRNIGSISVSESVIGLALLRTFTYAGTDQIWPTCHLSKTMLRSTPPLKSDRFVGQQLYRTKCGYQIRVPHVCCTYLTTTLCSAAPQTCHLSRGGLPCIFGPNLVCPCIRGCTS